MATPLRSRLDDLASAFASGVLAAIRGASLEDLLSETSGSSGRGPSAARSASSRRPAAAGPDAAAAPARTGKRGRLARRSATDIAGMIERIVGLLKQSPKGLRAEQIRARLGLVAKEMPRPLKEGLAAGRLAKSGEKRSTTYFAKGGGAPAKAAPAAKPGKSRSAKKAPARRGRARKASKATATPKPARARSAKAKRATAAKRTRR